MWKTTDGGENWVPVTDFKISSASVGAVAVSETDPDLVFIGTGETCIRGNIMPGDGVYRTVVEDTLAELRAAGATVIEIDMPELDEAGERYFDGQIVQPEFLGFLERDLPEWIPLLHPIAGKRLGAAGDVRALDYLAALHERRRLSAVVHARLASERIDLLATPTLPIAPPPLAALSRLGAYRDANRLMLSGTCPASMLDLCAISLPAGLDGEGMPAGLQLMGRAGADLAVLAQAAAVESVLGTHLTRLGTPPRVGASSSAELRE